MTDEKQGIWHGMRIPVFGITGEKFSGKTLLASTIDPAGTLMIDLEKSSESYNLPFKRRVDLYDELQELAGTKGLELPTPQDAFLWFKETCEAIQPGEYTTIVVDPISDIESGLADWVRSNPKMFGRTSEQYAKASGLVWGDVKAWWKMFLGMMSTKVETLAFTVHMGFEWKGATPTTKRKPKGKETLFELASLYLQLERKPDNNGKMSKEPSAIVLKSRLANTIVRDNGEIDIVPILPPRIDKATVKTIRHYIDNPPNFAKLKVGERHVPEGLTDDDRLELAAQKARDEMATEEMKLSRLEMMKKAAQDQAAARMGATAPAAATTVPTPTPKPKPEPEPDTAPAPAEAATEVATDETPPFETIEPPDVRRVIEDQRGHLGITDPQWAAIIAKRGVTSSSDLSDEQAEEIRKALWSKLTARDVGKA